MRVATQSRDQLKTVTAVTLHVKFGGDARAGSARVEASRPASPLMCSVRWHLSRSGELGHRTEWKLLELKTGYWAEVVQAGSSLPDI